MEALRIDFRNIEGSDWIKKLVSAKTSKLTRFCDKLLKCHVTVSALDSSHRSGRTHEVKIDLRVPGKEFVVKNAQMDADPAKAIAVACERAFDSAQRDLSQYMQIKRNRVKTHAMPDTAGAKFDDYETEEHRDDVTVG